MQQSFDERSRFGSRDIGARCQLGAASAGHDPRLQRCDDTVPGPRRDESGIRERGQLRRCRLGRLRVLKPVTCMALARIATACSRVMLSVGWKVPSSYPSIRPYA